MLNQCSKPHQLNIHSIQLLVLGLSVSPPDCLILNEPCGLRVCATASSTRLILSSVSSFNKLELDGGHYESSFQKIFIMSPIHTVNILG